MHVYRYVKFVQEAVMVYFINVYFVFLMFGRQFLTYQKFMVELYFFISQAEVKKEQSDYIIL